MPVIDSRKAGLSRSVLVVFAMAVWNLAACQGYHAPEGRPDATSPEKVVADLPRFIDVDYIDSAKIARVSRFRSAVGHDYSDDFETCRSMKHYFQPRAGVDPATIAISAPVSGRIEDLREEWAGTQVAIAADTHPTITVVIFHVNLAIDMTVGDYLTAGQHLGTHIGAQTMSDVAVRVQTPTGQRLASYFEVMTDRLFAIYQARGVGSRSDAIIGRIARDRQPLHCQGDRFVEAESPADWLRMEEVSRE